MKKIISILMLCAFILTGCNNTQESNTRSTYDKAISEGKIAIASKEYEKALGLYELAVSEKENKEDRDICIQLENIIKAKELLEEEKIEEAIKVLENIINSEIGVESITKEATELKAKLEEKNQEENDESIEEEELVIENDENESKEIIEEDKAADTTYKCKIPGCSIKYEHGHTELGDIAEEVLLRHFNAPNLEYEFNSIVNDYIVKFDMYGGEFGDSYMGYVLVNPIEETVEEYLQ